MFCNKHIAAICLLVILQMGSGPSLNAEPVIARWQPYQLRFQFSSFDTYYTCDGLADKLEVILLAIGARDDVRIEDNCQGASSDVQMYHRILVAFSLPVIADMADPDDETFPAEWQEVTVRKNRPRRLDGGDCELMEEFIDQIVPEINTRSLDEDIRCSRTSVYLDSLKVTMTVLMPLDLPDDAVTD